MKRMLVILLFAAAGLVAACSSSPSATGSPALDQPSVNTSSAAPSEEMSAAPSVEASPSS
jgi:hypothetical protein